MPPEMVVRLLEAAEDLIVEKIRWKLGRWELDRFLGTLEGLALMEIEIDSESDPLSDPLHGVYILPDVTDDNLFVSRRLARLDSKKQRKLVKKAYKEVKAWMGLSD